MSEDKTSMLYWYPQIKDLPIPQPRTDIVNLTPEEIKGYNGSYDCGFKLNRLENEVKKLVNEKHDLPVFMRTDQTSAKHGWKKTCYLNNPNNLKKQLFELIVFNKTADLFGLPLNAIIVREYIPMDTIFYAFHGEMPVNPEIRFFVKDGKTLCKHWYWVKDAIHNPINEDGQIIFNWEEKILEYNSTITMAEHELLNSYAEQVSKRISGYWSVDFCRAKDKRWILIDMAEGEKSWHPDH